MQRLNNIVEIDEEIFEVFQDFIEKFSDVSKSFVFPKTLSTFMNFISSTNFIKEGIIELARTDNAYSLNILFRSLIEQFLKFQYIWMKFLEKKDDTIGEEYMEFYSYSEDIDYAKAWSKIYIMINHIPEKDPIDIIKEGNPNFEGLANADLKLKVSQFNYRTPKKFV